MTDTKQPSASIMGVLAKLRSKKVLFVVGGVVVIAALAVIFVWHPWNRGDQASQDGTASSSNGNANSGQAVTASDEYAKLVPPDLSTKADAAAESGDVNGAVEVYQAAIESSSDAKQKSALYMQQAVVYANDDRYDDAIDAAKKSEAAEGQTITNVSFLASTYERVEQYDLAATYYKKASELTPNVNSSAGDKDYFLQKAKDNEAKL